MSNPRILHVDDLLKPENIEYLELLTKLDLLSNCASKYPAGAVYFLDTLRMVRAYGEPVLDPTTKQNLKNSPTCLLTAYFACSAPALEFLEKQNPEIWQVVKERQKVVRSFFEITEKYGIPTLENHSLTTMRDLIAEYSPFNEWALGTMLEVTTNALEEQRALAFGYAALEAQKCFPEKFAAVSSAKKEAFTKLFIAASLMCVKTVDKQWGDTVTAYRLQQDGLSLEQIHALTQKPSAFQDTIHNDPLAAEFKAFLENRGNDQYR